jgi:hypothetical protein
MDRFELCPRCGGDGVLKIPGGVKTCPTCQGQFWAAAALPSRLDTYLARRRALLLAVEPAPGNDQLVAVLAARLNELDQLEAALAAPSDTVN